MAGSAGSQFSELHPIIISVCWNWSLLRASTLFAYNYLGQKQFAFITFYAFSRRFYHFNTNSTISFHFGGRFLLFSVVPLFLYTIWSGCTTGRAHWQNCIPHSALASFIFFCIFRDGWRKSGQTKPSIHIQSTLWTNALRFYSCWNRIYLHLHIMTGGSMLFFLFTPLGVPLDAQH